jgi:hypothetical protein
MIYLFPSFKVQNRSEAVSFTSVESWSNEVYMRDAFSHLQFVMWLKQNGNNGPKSYKKFVTAANANETNAKTATNNDINRML